MDAPEKSAAPSIEGVVVPPKKGGSLLPLVGVVVMVPVLCYGMMDFVVIPKLKGSMRNVASAGQAGDGAASAKPKAEGGAKDSGAAGERTVDFGVTMVNLSGASSSRYLRVNFVVASTDSKIEDIIKEHQSALRDAAINVLSSQTVASLDAQGGRNAVRNQLIDQFNRTLGSQVVSQIYFSEFVIQ